MAVALLLLCHEGDIRITDEISNGLFFGELGLDGMVKRIDGLLPSVLDAVRQ